MIKISNHTIKTKLIFIIMTTSLVAVLLSGVLFIIFSYRFNQEELVSELKNLSDIVAYNSVPALIFDLPEDAEKILNSLSVRLSIKTCHIYDREGNFFASYHNAKDIQSHPKSPTASSHFFKDGSLHIFQDIKEGQTVIGWIYIEDNLTNLYAGLRKDLIILSFVVVLAFFVSYFISVRLQKIISEPILSLADVASKVSKEKDYSIRGIKQSEDEVGYLIDSFNKMLSQIQQSEEILKESETRYRAIVEDQTELICRYKKDGTVTFVNGAYCKYFNKDPKNFIGKSFMPLVYEEDKLKVKEHFDSLTHDNPVATYEYRVIAPDGQVRWQRWTNRIILNDKGEIVEFQGIARDITERKEVENQIERFRKFAEASSQGFCMAELDGKISYANRALSRFLGEEFSDKIIGTSVFEFYSEKNLEKLKNEILPVVEKEGQWLGEISLFSKNKKELPTIQNIFMIYDENKKPIFLANVLTDITEHKKAEEDLKKAKGEIEKWNKELTKRVEERTNELKISQAQLIQAEKLSAVGQLAAGIAHELNSPLAGILGLLRAYRKGKKPDSSEYKELQSMIEASEYMAKIIRDLVSFTRISKEEYIDCSFNQIIDSVLTFISFDIIKNNIKIHKNFAKDLLNIKGDIPQLKQVVLNVITNSRDAMPNGGDLFIKTYNSINDGMVVMEFSDTGCGIRKEDIPNIFNPFFTTKDQGRGVGLGLSVSHGIIKNHKGKISVESKLGKGSKFIVKISKS